MEFNLKLFRREPTDESTIGDLYLNNDFFCFTLEDAIRDHKEAGRTAIPAGTYKGIFTFSNRFQRVLPLLLDVPGYEGVRIHSGNTAKDTEGCILLGFEKKPNMIWKSRPALETFLFRMKREPFTITIINPDDHRTDQTFQTPQTL